MTRRGIYKNRIFILVVILALMLFIPLFILRGIGAFDFWWWMSGNLVLLVTIVIATDKTYQNELAGDFKSHLFRKALLGIVSAVVLYGVFFIGNGLSRWMFDFAGRNISYVYGFKGDAEALRIGLLMLFIIGPGEELLWRGYIQGVLSKSLGKVTGFLLGVFLYTLIHVATGNLILILAALVGGLFWGWMYLKYNSMLMNIASHIVWDIAIFLVFPLNG